MIKFSGFLLSTPPSANYSRCCVLTQRSGIYGEFLANSTLRRSGASVFYMTPELKIQGTVLNIALIAGILFGCIRFGIIGDFEDTFLHILIFASLIAAVDPVAVGFI